MHVSEPAGRETARLVRRPTGFYTVRHRINRLYWKFGLLHRIKHTRKIFAKKLD
jgi:hypothetical protein